MHSLLLRYLVVWRPLGYFLVCLGVIIEGDVVVFTAAFLAEQAVEALADELRSIEGRQDDRDPRGGA